ncbi:MAG: hypothetical protein AB8I08_40595 [Sandaracinaceae bacterium]
MNADNQQVQVSARVLYEGKDPNLQGVASAVQEAFGAPPEPADDDRSGPIALPLGAAPPPGLDEASVVVSLDPESDSMAHEAGVATRVVLFPSFDTAWSGPLDADLVLVAHDGMIPDVVSHGAARKRVHTVGPVAPIGWGPAEDRLALLEARQLAGPVVVVRAAALLEGDLAPSLVQLSLVRGAGTWLFDVGSDASLAAELRRRVPGHGLRARMFADGPEAQAAYRAADVVLGRIAGPEVLRALAVGASVATVAPRSSQARLAHRLESEGLAQIADAAATLAVTLDASLSETRMAAGRAASLAAAAPEGATRVVRTVSEALAGRLGDAPPTGLPVGLEPLDAGEEPAVSPPVPEQDDLDKQVDDELAALRAKLGL